MTRNKGNCRDCNLSFTVTSEKMWEEEEMEIFHLFGYLFTQSTLCPGYFRWCPGRELRCGQKSE